MTLHTLYIQFQSLGSDSKEMNQAIGKVRERFKASEARIINIETVQPTSFFGLFAQPGGLRVWYETNEAISE